MAMVTLQPLLRSTRGSCLGTGSSLSLGRKQAARSLACSRMQENLVVLTRERGKNERVMKALLARDIRCVELPLIEHYPGPDRDKLPQLLADKTFQWIVITSPEAAAVFIDCWRNAGFPKVRVAVVGKGTREVFDRVYEHREKLRVEFVPSQAKARILASELPMLEPSGQVLYPASVQAGDELASGLTERGFQVCRLDTYSTESVREVDKSRIEAALRASVLTFASPTAVKGWIDVVKPIAGEWEGAVACIGGTSATAALQAGMQRVHFPDKPSLEGWVQCIERALDLMQ